MWNPIKTFSNLSIIVKLSLLVSLSIIFVISLGNIWSYLYLKEYNLESIENTQREINTNTLKALEFYFNTQQVALQALRKEIVENPNLSDKEIINLLELFRVGKDLDLLYIGLDKSIKNIRSNGKILSLETNYDVRERGWYKFAKNKTSQGEIEFGITTPYKDSSGNISVSYVLPMYRDGEFIGVIASDDNLSKLSNLLEVGKTKVGTTNVYDSDGTIVFHTEQDKVLSKNTLSENIAKSLQTNPGLTNGTLFEVVDNEKELSEVICSNIAKTNFVACSIVKKDFYYKELRNNLVRQVISGGIGILIALSLVTIVLFYILSPLKKLQWGIQNFFDYLNFKRKDIAKNPIIADDEIGKITEKINDGIEQTKQRYQQEEVMLKETIQVCQDIEQGILSSRITAIPNNPNLLNLQKNFNLFLDILEKKIGSNFNLISEILDCYKNSNFTAKVQNEKGEMEVNINALGIEISKMLNQRKEFANLLNEKARKHC
ncbi:hypothetical protein LS70_005930 [Helicobacter sp. MIT 11-5569]|uniref:cache domain-containing protein n=1 Tax=Helicobacter sp. MIT 11-5569 TaxID=1548151 RepID=UPI0006909BF4|nr:cache domain-containing protein [Helicobacter sp. MIT 11-5569]TLD83281.1 hypothetical protein LS70_005930 [Helicobacter sp. MIT 11-5569]